MLTILHTNDFHNRLQPQQAERLRAMKAALGPETLLLDAGDAVAAGNITFRPGGEPILDLMNRAGYDAMTIGNREFHFSRFGMERTLNRAQFPVLCANMRRTGRVPEEDRTALPPEGTLPTRPYVVLEQAEIGRIVVFGLTVPMITEQMLARKVSAFVFDPPIDTAQVLVPRLRTEYQPTLLIALTHIGISKDRALAERVPGIDLIIGGHSHTRLETGERVGETLIVQADCYAHLVGSVAVERGPEPDGSDGFSGRWKLTASVEAL